MSARLPLSRRSRVVRICAWCTRYLDPQAPEQRSAEFAPRGKSVSHGICSECASHLEQDWRGRPA